ncbi:MAG: DUF3857 domain-containing protein [Gammaproteobacteria bacterium]|nr:DUF3857 domain-containing protein [Gammaproteobacteria bacterium]MBP9728843.1 DUF3857 domain-containing protein [Gammaproteobacteria bacterium]
MVIAFIRRFSTYLLLALIAHSSPLYARFATLEDADFKFEIMNQTITVQADGSYTERIEIQAKVLKEAGKDRLVSLALPYNASNTTFKVLAAKTIVGGTEYPVDPQHIEDKPLASNVHGFDQNNQVLVAFQKLQLNASIYIQFETFVKDPPLAGFFDHHINFGFNGYCEHGTFEIQSAIPLHIAIHDLQKNFESIESQKEGLFYFKASLKKPAFFKVIDEQNSLLNEADLPWIRIATLKEWPDFAMQIAAPFEAVIQEPLPAYFKPILDKALQYKNSIDQINAITAGLAESLTYMGDWRTVKGAYSPRSLAKIAETRFGDCKDFSAITVALLRQLGLQASTALVNRGIQIQHDTFILPSFNHFNHAIVYATTKHGSYWIDPTNFTSFAPHIYPDIANRKSLILFEDHPQIEHIPDIVWQDSEVRMTESIHLEKQGTIHAQGHLDLSGWKALNLTGSDLRTSKETTDLDIIRHVTNENRLLAWKVQDYHLKSRIVKPLAFSFEYSAQNSTIRSSAGKAYLLGEYGGVKPILVKTKNRVSNLYLGTPSIVHYELILLHTKTIGNQFLDCHFKSPWFEGQRHIENTPEGIKVSDTQILLRSIISNKDLHSKSYQELQSKVYTCFGDLALIYETKDKR